MSASHAPLPQENALQAPYRGPIQRPAHRYRPPLPLISKKLQVSRTKNILDDAMPLAARAGRYDGLILEMHAGEQLAALICNDLISAGSDGISAEYPAFWN